MFSVAGIEKQLNNLQPHKAAGPDAIPPRILRDLAKELAPSLAILFQQMYDKGVIPQDWRALVTPIHKKGPKRIIYNYRPVSLTCIISKINEHIVCSSIMEHLKLHSILDPDQHGFRKGLSTETQLIAAIHDWAGTINSQGQSDVAFLDFSKAFDSVPHQRLLHKLRFYGISGNTSRIIESMLQNRRQRVVLNGTKSSWVPVLSGVPQGTVIGPILFLVYINDIREGISSKMRLFADDSIIYREIKSEADHHILMNDLKLLQEWSDKWQMIFKPEKCFIMNITNKKNPSLFTYSLSSTPLEVVKTLTYLGAVIDDKLTWNEHYDHVRKKALAS